MKLIIVCILFLVSLNSLGSIKSTISDGSWFDPAIWSPAGVPLMEDTVIVNHQVTVIGNYVDYGANLMIVNTNASVVGDTIFSLHGDLRLYGTMSMNILAIGDGDSVNVYGTVAGRKFVPGNTTNTNYGIILSDSLIAGANFVNYGSTDNMILVSGGNVFQNKSGGSIVVSGQVILGALSTVNELNAFMDLGSLVTSENSTNNGDIKCLNWTHGSGTASGITGKYCIQDCFMNVSTISGTLDVCDASPGGFCDFNGGTISGTVTQCAVQPCFSNSTVSELISTVFVYPNPASDFIILNTSKLGQTYSICNAVGKLITSNTITNENQKVDISTFENGLYYVEITGSNYANFRFIKK